MRHCIAVGALLIAGISPLLVQCRDEPRQSDEVKQTGQLNLPLEAFGRSGNRYRLRDAVFIVERRIGASSSGVGGDNGFGGDENFGGGAGFGGSFSSGGGFGVGGSGFASGGGPAFGGSGFGGSGTGGSGVGGSGGSGGSSSFGGSNGFGGGDAGSGGGSGFSVTVSGSTVSTVSGFSAVTTTGGIVTGVTGVGGGSSDGEFELETILFSEDHLFDAEIVERLRSGDYRITLQPGWIMERTRPNGDTAFVQADLLSPSRQFFQIFPRDVSFVFYGFLVDGDQVIFGQDGDLVVGIDVEEVNSGSFDPRSLIETSQEAVSFFSLEDTLDAIGANAGLQANGRLMYQQIIDSYASAPGRLESTVHCGDESPGGAQTLNGYPIRCDRLEAEQFDNLESWFATAVVNRIDLAPQNGAHCGQQRLIFANSEPIGNGRMFMIVESQLPNPSPELGAEGCLPVAQFWRSLEDIDDPVLRGLLLNDAFLGSGVPGFGPFMDATRLTAGTGQIRTNNFNDFVWTLREFKVVENDGAAGVVPFPVAESPHGPLWNDTLDFPFGAQCRQSFLQAMDGLMSDDPAQMGFVVDHECKDAESENNFFTGNYPEHLSEGTDEFLSEIEARLEGTDLSPFDVARRAQFAGSCIGCHEEGNGLPLGHGISAPFSNGFVHVEEFLEDCGNGSQCFRISQALREVFLPHRAEVMNELLGDSGGAGGAGGGSGFGGEGPESDEGFTSVSTNGLTASTATTGMPFSPGLDGEAPPGLASSELSTEELVIEDEEAKTGWGEHTLGGQPVKVSH